MEKVLIHSVHPEIGTGYGSQCGAIAKMLTDAGYRVVISAFAGALGGGDLEWNGIQVINGSGGSWLFGQDTLEYNVERTKADLVITVNDAHVYREEYIRPLTKKVPVGHLVYVDCDPLGCNDRKALLGSKARAIAPTRFAKEVINRVGMFQPALYLPAAIDTQSTWTPLDKRDCRGILGIPEDTFVVMSNGRNQESDRKSWAEMFCAFMILQAKYPDCLFLAHTEADARPGRGRPLDQIVRSMEIPDKCVRFADRGRYFTGGYSQHDLAVMYSAADVYLCGSKGEGFCVPIIEAAACGTPSIGTNWSSLPEVIGRGGWLVPGQAHWNDERLAWWLQPFISDLARKLILAREDAGELNRKAGLARQHSLDYDIDNVRAKYTPALMDSLLG